MIPYYIIAYVKYGGLQTVFIFSYKLAVSQADINKQESFSNEIFLKQLGWNLNWIANIELT